MLNCQVLLLSVMGLDLLARVAFKVGTFVAKYQQRSICNITNYVGKALDSRVSELQFVAVDPSHQIQLAYHDEWWWIASSP